MENPLSRHLYAYVGNNPARYVDPTGRWASDPVNHEWKKSTHRWITGRGIDLVYYKSNADASFKNNIYFSYRSWILNGSDDADKDDFPYESHFYDVEEKANYLGGQDTALNQLKVQYSNAVNQYKNAFANYNKQFDGLDNKKCMTIRPIKPLSAFIATAFYSLGKAVHFIQDLNNPYHASNMIQYAGIEYLKQSNHMEYESSAITSINQDRRKYIETAMNFQESTTVEKFGNAAAVRSHIPDSQWAYDDKLMWSEASGYYTIKIAKLKNSNLMKYIKSSERDTAQILYSFYLNTH